MRRDVKTEIYLQSVYILLVMILYGIYS